MWQFEKYSVYVGRIQYHWLLRDTNGELFCKGNYYLNRAERDAALAVICKRFPGVPVVDKDKH
jgi:uncharacterized protein YegP (UPF0339 family)